MFKLPKEIIFEIFSYIEYDDLLFYDFYLVSKEWNYLLFDPIFIKKIAKDQIHQDFSLFNIIIEYYIYKLTISNSFFITKKYLKLLINKLKYNNINKFIWNCISSKQKLTKQFIEQNKNNLNTLELHNNPSLTLDLIESYVWDWTLLTKNINLNQNIKNKYKIVLNIENELRNAYLLDSKIIKKYEYYLCNIYETDRKLIKKKYNGIIFSEIDFKDKILLSCLNRNALEKLYPININNIENLIEIGVLNFSSNINLTKDIIIYLFKRKEKTLFEKISPLLIFNYNPMIKLSVILDWKIIYNRKNLIRSIIRETNLLILYPEIIKLLKKENNFWLEFSYCPYITVELIDKYKNKLNWNILSEHLIIDEIKFLNFKKYFIKEFFLKNSSIKNKLKFNF